MGAIKEKLRKLRSGTAEPPPATTSPEAPKAASPAAPAASSTGAGRFAHLAGAAAGDLSEGHEEGREPVESSVAVGQDDDIPFEALAPQRPSPDATSQKAPRRFAPATKEGAPGPTPADQQLKSIIDAWSDPSRPAGSSYQAGDWDLASESGAMVVFEMIKPDQIGLCAVARASLNEVEALLYDRSLIVCEGADGFDVYPKHAAMIYRSSDLRSKEVLRYKIVRSQQAIEKTPWLNGSVLRNEEEVAHNAAERQVLARGNNPAPARFSNIPRQR
jgi:hypothetical protein